MPAIQLEKLLNVLPDKIVTGDINIKIENISSYSKKITARTLFVAIPGFVYDGLNFVPEAIKNGATVILAEKNFVCPNDITKIIVPSARKAIALLAACFYDYPSEKLKLIGITGTKGKTTTAHLIYSILKESGVKAGLSTTIEVQTTKNKIETKRTTNEALDIQNFLAQLVIEKAEYAIMEVSSHGLALDRVTGCSFDAALFTNLSHDHLDFHHNLSEYLDAKLKLFEMLKKSGTGITNIDDLNGQSFLDICKYNKLTYSLNKKADIFADKIIYDENGISCKINTPCGNFDLQSSLHGAFNLYNILAAASIGISQNISLTNIKKGLENVKYIPGRFEYIECGQPFKIIIDYAHSPDSLEQVLKTARNLAKGRVMLVFGATGNRDKTKRPIMGKIAAELSDFFIITNDDTYNECPMEIIEQIEIGTKNTIKKNNIKYKVIPERRDAIYALIKDAKPDDFLIIAGKGHETKQILKDRTVDFNDRKVVEKILRSFSNSKNF
ncbi:MAG: UDP-N-acetylmuramoyl-L-alanyl-D-glutamate--2,6-diaminopimelate ligase [bacterium]